MIYVSLKSHLHFVTRFDGTKSSILDACTTCSFLIKRLKVSSASEEPSMLRALWLHFAGHTLPSEFVYLFENLSIVAKLWLYGHTGLYTDNFVAMNLFVTTRKLVSQIIKWFQLCFCKFRILIDGWNVFLVQLRPPRSTCRMIGAFRNAPKWVMS